MTKNLAILGAGKYGLTANITASSQQPGYEAAFLSDTRRFYCWRSAVGDLSAVDIFFDFGAPVALDSIVLGGTNLELSATTQLWAGTDPTFATNLWTQASGPAFDTSLPVLRDWKQPWGRDVVFTRPAGTVAVQYGKIRLTDAGNPDGYLSADFCFPDAAWQPIRNYKADYQANDQFVGNEGMTQVLRGFTCNLGLLTKSEQSQITSLIRDLKSIGRFYLIPSPLDSSLFLQQGMMATFQKAAEFQGVDKGGRFRSTSLEFLEVDN